MSLKLDAKQKVLEIQDVRRRLEQGDAAAADEAELLLRKGGDRLLLLKLHRAVVLQLLISGKPAAAAQVQARTP